MRTAEKLSRLLSQTIKDAAAEAGVSQRDLALRAERALG